MIEDIWKVGGGILGVVLVAWIIYEIVNLNETQFLISSKSVLYLHKAIVLNEH